MSAEVFASSNKWREEATITNEGPFNIDDIQPGREFDVPGSGHFYSETVRFSDGVTYQKRLGVPGTLDTYQTPVVFTSPWFTGIDGFNTEIAKRLTARGIPVLIIGAPTMPTEQFSGIEEEGVLNHDVAAEQQILDFEEGAAGISFRKVICYGYSRGGMEGYGLVATAAANNRQIAYFDFVDPCLEHAPGETERNIGDLVRYFGKEALSAGVIVGRNKHPIRMLRSFEIGPRSVRQHANIGRALFRGEAGKLAVSVPEDAVGLITLFNSSRLNHAADWKRVYAHHPYVSFKDKPGLHATGIEFVLSRTSIDRIELAAQLADNSDTVGLRTTHWNEMPDESA